MEGEMKPLHKVGDIVTFMDCTGCLYDDDDERYKLLATHPGTLGCMAKRHCSICPRGFA